MFLTFFRSCFYWLPTPLYLLVSAIFTVFAVIVAVQVIKLLASIIRFIVDVLGGLWVKVVQFFV